MHAPLIHLGTTPSSYQADDIGRWRGLQSLGQHLVQRLGAQVRVQWHTMHTRQRHRVYAPVDTQPVTHRVAEVGRQCEGSGSRPHAQRLGSSQRLGLGPQHLGEDTLCTRTHAPSRHESAMTCWAGTRGVVSAPTLTSITRCATSRVPVVHMPWIATTWPGNKLYARSSRTSTMTRAPLEPRREPSSKMAPRVRRPPSSGQMRPHTITGA